MSYSIKKTDGSELIELKENTGVNSSIVSNIGLISKLTPNYGGIQSENFIHLAENFANDTFPSNALKGMLCYRNDLQSLYLCINPFANNDDERWKKIPNVNLSSIEPNISSAEQGDFWFNEKSKKLFIFDKETKNWICIGPEDYLNKISLSLTAETGASDKYVYEYDFQNNKEYDNTSYLVQIKIIGKEIIQPTSSLYNTVIPQTAGWTIKCLINSYPTTIDDISFINREIIGNPCYELIGKSNGIAKDWNVDVKINSNKNLEITTFGLPTSYIDETYVKWLINIEMNKVFDKE